MSRSLELQVILGEVWGKARETHSICDSIVALNMVSKMDSKSVTATDCPSIHCVSHVHRPKAISSCKCRSQTKKELGPTPEYCNQMGLQELIGFASLPACFLWGHSVLLVSFSKGHGLGTPRWLWLFAHQPAAFFWDAHLLFDLTAFLCNGFLQCSLQRCREIRQRLGDSTNEELEISNLAN